MNTAANDTASSAPAWLPAGPALLFAPADRPDRFAKAAERSDVVIVDLEDGAALDGHEAARQNIVDNPLDPARTILRVTGPDAPTFAGDAKLAQEGPYDVVMLPKVRDRIPEELAGLKIIAMIETPEAILNIGAIASHPDVVGMFWGAEDLAADLPPHEVAARQLAPGATVRLAVPADAVALYPQAPQTYDDSP